MRIQVTVPHWLTRFVQEYLEECRRMGLNPDVQAMRTMAQLAVKVQK